jgi:TMEM175 potassium channel family protein
MADSTQPAEGGPAEGAAPPGPDPLIASVSRAGLLSRSGHLEYDRILFFSDAVFAIAITLLIVDLPVRIEDAASTEGRGSTAVNSLHELHLALPGIVGFGISFAVIGLFWLGHHGLFRFVTAFDRRLMLLNLLFVGTIAFLPYPTALLSSVSASETAAVIFYAACAGGAGLVETAIWLYATHARTDLVTAMSPAMRRFNLLRIARIPAVFAASIVVAVFSAQVASYCWALVLVTGSLINHYYGQRGRVGGGPPDPDPADPRAAV